MDGLFVARNSKSDEGSRISLDRDGARQIVEAMAQEIAVDEAMHCEATPDQRRVEALLQNDGGIVDSLFARRGERSESMAESVEKDGLAQSLFARPERSEAAEPAAPEDAEDEAEESELDSTGSPEVLDAAPEVCQAARSEAEGTMEAPVQDPSEAKPSERFRWPSARQCLPILAVVALLVLVTAAIAMGCEDAPPLGRFCIAEGPVQWCLAMAPAVLGLLALVGWLRHRRSRHRAIAEMEWRQDGEAHRNALELLDALLDSPPAEAAKYSKQLLQIATDFPEKAVIQHKVCLAVEEICAENKSHATQMQAYGAVPILLNALEEHRRVRQVQRGALDALAHMTRVARQQIFDLGGIPNVVAAMTKFRRDADVQVAGAMVLGGLCVNSDACRLSVGKYGGINVLTAALDRHKERPDAVIAAAETLALLASGRQGDILQRMMPALPLVQAMIADLGEDAAAQVVLRSLQKLEAQLLSQAKHRTAKDDDEWSDIGTPRQKVQKALVKNAQDEAKQVSELHDRFKRWNHRRQ